MENIVFPGKHELEKTVDYCRKGIRKADMKPYFCIIPGNSIDMRPKAAWQFLR